MPVKFPDINVPLVGEAGTASAILGRVTKAMTYAGKSRAERDEFLREATSGDYDNLLAVVMRTVTVDGGAAEAHEEEEEDNR